MMTQLHDQRLEVLLRTLLASRAETVLDLGCGHGLLLARLLRERQFRKIVGVDLSIGALGRARDEFRADLEREGARLSLVRGSFTDQDERFVGFDAAAMVETLEHVDPRWLSKVERSVFTYFRPRTVIITTPNREYNVLFDRPEGRLRHPDHRFEWPRAKFRDWAAGLARRNGYRVAFSGVGRPHPTLGCPTQMAQFTRIERDKSP